MSEEWVERRPPRLRWRLEWLLHSVMEGLAAFLPGTLVFRLGECLGGLAWHVVPKRRRMLIRNLRIALAGEPGIDAAEIGKRARASFRRTGANLISATHTARLPVEKVRRVVRLENGELLEKAQAAGKGVVLLLAHMGKWELLTKLVHIFPPGSKCGAFYRPLNNPLLDARLLRHRQADGTRMFSKRDPFHQVTGFLREGGIVGILSDQRVGMQGEVVSFFGRQTRATPLPSLLARRAKAEVLALSLATEAPGRWVARFLPVAAPHGTAQCMEALENAMKTSLVDCFWLQERWKVYAGGPQSFAQWLDGAAGRGSTPHRALLWLADAPEHPLPEGWRHPDLDCELVLPPGRQAPPWLPEGVPVLPLPADCTASADRLAAFMCERDQALPQPLDFILAVDPPPLWIRAAKRAGLPLISLP